MAWLRIEPAGWRVPLLAGLSLLESAQRAGVRLPRSCRNGTCRACLCRRLAGATRHRIDWPGLSAEELADGWILPCVAEPVPAAPQEGAEVVIEQPAARLWPGPAGASAAAPAR